MRETITIAAGERVLVATHAFRSVTSGDCWNVRITSSETAIVFEQTCDRHQLLGVIVEFTCNATA